MNQEIAQKLEKWIDEHFEELIEDVKRMVRIPSVATYDEADFVYGGNCKRALDEMTAIAQGYGLSTENYEDRCGSASFDADCAPENEIGIWGHLDVVPAGDGWLLTDPYDPVVKEGYLIGRGADDNKGPAMGALYILRALKELNIPTRHGLRLFYGCDEEYGMSDAQYFTANYPARKLNVIADCGFPVCYGEKGIIEASIVSASPVESITALQAGMASNIVPDKAEMALKGCAENCGGEHCAVECADGKTLLHGSGIAGHTAFPEGSINAIHAVMQSALNSGLLSEKDAQAIGFMKRINDDRFGTALGIGGEDELSGKTTCVGSMANIDADGRAVLHLNIRYCISAKAEELLKAMEEACRANGCAFKLGRVSEPNYFPRENPVVDAMTDVFNVMTGSKAEPYVMGGGTYARKLKNALGFGLGGLEREATQLFAKGHGNCHQVDEGLHLANYKRGLLIFAMGLLEADAVL